MIGGIVALWACGGGDGNNPRLGPYSSEPSVDVSCKTTLPVTTFHVLPANPKLVWASVGNYDEPNRAAYFHSRDGGVSWRGFGTAHAAALLDETTAVAYGQPSDRSQEIGAYRIDFDASGVPTWTAVASDIQAYYMAPSGDGRAYGTDILEQGYRIDNGGDTWTLLDVQGVQQLVASGDHVAMWKDTTIHVSSDAGATFAQHTLPSSGAQNGLAHKLAMGAGGELVAVHEGLVWVSRDGAATWREILPMTDSTPGRQNFEIFPAIAGDTLWLSVDFRRSSAYDGIEGGLLVSTSDWGQSFTRRHPTAGPLVGTGVMVQDDEQAKLRFAPRYLVGLPDGNVMMAVSGTDSDVGRGGGLCVTGAGNDDGFPTYLPATIPSDKMVAYDHYGTARITAVVDFVVDHDGKAHFYEEAQVRSGPAADHEPWYVPSLREPPFGQNGVARAVVVGFDFTPAGEVILGATPDVLGPQAGPSPRVVYLDPSDQTEVQFVETGQVSHDELGVTEAFYAPLLGIHVNASGDIFGDVVGGPSPWADADSYRIPFQRNVLPGAIGGMYSPFSNDAFYQRNEAGVAIVVRVAAGDDPNTIKCTLDTPTSTRCFRFPGGIFAATVSDDDKFYVVDSQSNDILVHDLSDPTGSWATVATGFVKPTKLFWDRSGQGVLYVVDGDVYAMIPDPNRVHLRQD